MPLKYFPLPKTRVIFNVRARRKLLSGVDKMARLVGPTLGPRPRNVAIQPIMSVNQSPELLDDAGTIMRRMIEIPDLFENMGAMLIRQIAWKVKEEVGDGAATAVILAESIMRESNRYIEAGGNPMMIRRGLERGLAACLAHLDEITFKVDSEDEISRVAIAVTGNEQMGRYLGEMFDIVGVEGTISVEESPRAEIDRRYVEGVSWDNGFFSPYMVTDQDRMEAILDSPLILITDHWVKKATELIPLMQRLSEAGEKNLFIIAPDIEADALALLVTNKLHNRLITVAAKSPGMADRRFKIMQDLAVLTGARVISKEAGDMLQDVELSDLGRAQRVWANKDYFSIIGGAGDPQKLRDRIVDVKHDIKFFKDTRDEYEFNKARERLGKLSGGAAILTVGAATEADLKLLKARAEDAIRSVRAAVEEGVVPGGGAALLSCAEAVKRLDETGDAAVGLKILARALEEPMRRIIINAGLEDAPVVERVRELGVGYGFDVIRGEVIPMVESGVYDPTKVVKAAVDAAVSGAMMAVTTEALILRKHHETDVAGSP